MVYDLMLIFLPMIFLLKINFVFYWFVTSLLGHISIQVLVTLSRICGSKSHVTFKRALDKYNIIPKLFPKKSWDFYTIRSVGMSNDCMLSFTF